MKAIELTQEHESKLLEMCKVLFPEYNVSWIDFKFDDSDLMWFKKDDPYECKGIHWFEFCMTHLINKLRDLLLQQNLINFGSSDSPWQVKQLMSAYYNVDYHPVDYLYEEFKKLKL